MRTYSLIGLLLLLSFLQLQAQLGCTDPQANNFDASATINDGSCLYPETNYVLPLVAELSEDLIENSGLAVFSQGLFTHNDAGNPNEIYRIDSLDGTVLQTLLVVADNEDWEDMAENDSHLFIGDFGNNGGDRTDLRIYRIPKSELSSNIVNAQPINFAFADQTDFSNEHNGHDYDCEAFFYHNDSLHLFTKNWADQQTRHYVIPTEPGYYPVLPRHSFDAEGLITAADISEDGTILLLGYTEVGFNFMWMLFDYPDNEFFTGNKRKVNLGSGLVNSQTEGIAFKDNTSGYISSELFDFGSLELPPKLLSFDIEQWLPSETVSIEEEKKKYKMSLFPNPFVNGFTIDLADNWPVGHTEVNLFNANGQLLMSQKIAFTERKITLNIPDSWPTGSYVIQLLNEHALWQKRVIKY